MNDSDDLQINQLLLKEEQRRYADITSDMRDIKSRTLTILSVEFVILAYLFSDIASIVPAELYGILFFAIGIIFVMFSVGALLFNVRAIAWPDPVSQKEIVQMQSSKNEAEATRIAFEDYRSASQAAESILAKRAKMLNLGLYSFVAGAIIYINTKVFLKGELT